MKFAVRIAVVVFALVVATRRRGAEYAPCSMTRTPKSAGVACGNNSGD